MSIKVVDKGFYKLVKSLKNEIDIDVGFIPKGKNEKVYAGTSTTTTEVARYNEFRPGIRPFFFPIINQKEEQYQDRMDRGVVNLLNSPETITPSKVLAVGERVAKDIIADVRDNIQNGSFEKLKDGTIAARIRKGNTSPKPLIDTGMMYKALEYKVNK